MQAVVESPRITNRRPRHFLGPAQGDLGGELGGVLQGIWERPKNRQTERAPPMSAMTSADLHLSSNGQNGRSTADQRRELESRGFSQPLRPARPCPRRTMDGRQSMLAPGARQRKGEEERRLPRPFRFEPANDAREPASVESLATRRRKNHLDRPGAAVRPASAPARATAPVRAAPRETTRYLDPAAAISQENST